MIDQLKSIKKVFPGSKIIVITPDRADGSKHVISELQAAGLSGIWRISKRGENDFSKKKKETASPNKERNHNSS